MIENLSYRDISVYFPQFDNFIKLKDVGFYWWGDKNVGDLLTLYFLKHVCKINDAEKLRAAEDFLAEGGRGQTEVVNRFTSFARKAFSLMLGRQNQTRAQKKMIISTGSVMRLCSPGVTVYGSGIRSKNQEVKQGSIEFVRGPLTRDALLKIQCDCPPIYGDPGLIISKYYQPKVERKRYRLGIIPHFTEYDDVLNLYKEDNDIKVINMGCGNIEQVLCDILQCSATVSSSLHGIVFSHSYSIPVRWIKFSGKVFGDDTKFKDYFLSIGRPSEDFIDAVTFKYLKPDYLISVIEDYKISINLDRLQDALFFNELGLKKTVLWLGENKKV